MDYFDKYAERIRVRGTLTADNEQDRMVNAMRADWENNPSFRRICVQNADGVVRSVRIQTAKKTVGMDKIYVHPDDTLNSGDIVLSMQDFSWLVLDTKLIGHVFKQANIVRINRNIQWIANGVLYEQTARVKNFSRVDGTDEYYFFHMPENTINIFLPLSEKTQTLTRDARLMVDKLPYKITRVDNFTYTGVTTLFLTEDIRNTNDTDNIADYIEAAPSPIEEVFIVGDSTIPYGFKATYMLQSGTDILPASWSTVESNDWFDLLIIGDTAQISIKSNIANIGKTITLQALHEGETYYKNIIVRSLV